MENHGKHSQRDESIDAALRRSLRRPVAGASGACVDAEAMAAWAEGTLPPGQAAAVEAHLANCSACQERLAVFARTAPPAGVPESLWQRWHLRWAVPIAAAAAAAAIWVAIPDQGRRLDDAFSTVQPTAVPQQTSAPAAMADQQAAAAKAVPPVEEKREAKSSDTLSNLEARSDAQSKRAESAREREADASGSPAPAAPAAAAPSATAAPQQTRPLADAQAGSLRQRQEAFAPIEAASPDGLLRWRILGGRLERSTTSGKTWEAVTVPQAVDLTAVRATSAMTATVTAADGRQFRTDDQGNTWHLVQP